MTDLINHPPHYEAHSIVLQPIDILEDLPFATANIFKYIIRAGDKGNELEDLKKARWYLNRVIKSDGSYVGSDRLWVFKFFVDIPMLQHFAFNLMDYQYYEGYGTSEAYLLLDQALNRRISELEKQNES